MKNIIPQLEREGGHIVTLAILFLICLAIVSSDTGNALATKAGDMLLGALLLAMRGNGDGKPDAGDTKTQMTVTQETTKPDALKPPTT